MPAHRLNIARKTVQGTLRNGRKTAVAHTRLTRVPAPPERLSDGARDEWRRLAPPLVAARTLTAADLRALEMLTETLATADAMAQVVRTEGTTIEVGSGTRKAHPALQALAQARAQAHRLLCDFGLTPRSRGAIDAAPPPDDERALTGLAAFR